MLLISDRSIEGAQLQRLLTSVAPCTLVALHRPATQAKTGGLLICDVALDNAMSIDLLRTAIAGYRGAAPMLVLLRDSSQLTRAQAVSLGATQTLPCLAARSDLLAAVKALLAQAGPAAALEAGPDIEADVADAGAALAELFGAAAGKAAISPKTLQRGGRAVLAAVGQARIQAWLDVVWTYDDFTYQHCLLVAGLAAAMALELGLSQPVQSLLSEAALVHDIGKTWISQAILQKAGALTPEERAIVRTHPARGYRLLAEQRSFDPRLLDIVLHHHELLDGSGYPDGLKGDGVPRLVRLVTICDIYAALIEHRPYKEPTPPDQALNVLARMGGKLDRGLLQVFGGAVRRA